MIGSVTVKDYMSNNVVTFKPDMNVMDAIRILLEQQVSAAPVVNKRGDIVGMLSEKDCLEVVLQAAYLEESGGPVSDYMSHGARTVNMEDNIVDVARMFLKDPFKIYPVLRDNVLVGLLRRRDVLKALEKLW